MGADGSVSIDRSVGSEQLHCPSLVYSWVLFLCLFLVILFLINIINIFFVIIIIFLLWFHY